VQVILAPLEFSAQKLSRAELQQKFYKRKAELEKIKGPSTPTLDFSKEYESVTEKEVATYDEKLGLVAPPILFQVTRKRKSGIILL